MEGEHSMPTNALCNCGTRLRDFGINPKFDRSYAMLFDLLPNTAYGIAGACVHTLAPTAIVVQRISVLTFMGGPPIFNE